VITAADDGRLVVETRAYRLEVAATGAKATLSAPSGAYLATLRLLAAVDRVDRADETLDLLPPRVGDDGATIELERRSTAWEAAGTTLVCGDDALEVRTWVRGAGSVGDVHLLGGRSLVPGLPTGFLPSGSAFRSLFTPNPGDPDRLVRGAAESAVVGTSGDGEPGRGHWQFTPAPLYLAFATAAVDDAEADVPDGWLDVGVVAPVDELRFVQLRYRPAEGGFAFVLDYDGHTRVDGEFRPPPLLLTPGVESPYRGLRRHREDLVVRGAAPAPAPRETPEWWLEPIFCGWGAQCHLGAASGRPAADFATQADYDAFLAHLEARGVVPGTVVVDDKWQAEYGTCTPDEAKWPDLRGWVAERRERGQHVLLWWKAWDPEGLPPELCVRDPDGRPVAVDPGNPAAREELARIVTDMLGRDGIDADGLKIDFTARTPSGHALSAHGPRWGIALLHELLAVVHRAAKAAKPDALVITHTPHPAFVDVTDMIRLNDMIRAEDRGPVPAVVRQMRYRAAVTRAACPELPIDTDDWCVPDLRTWRAYLDAKVDLGVPALYYVSNVDSTGEQLTDGDYDAIRRRWDAWRASIPARR